MSRAEFERWMVEDFKCVVGSSDPYPAGIERDMWRCWQAATSARVKGLEAFILRNSDPYDMNETDTALFHEIGKRLVPQNY